jgi:arylsulfatase A-like enzyme
MKVLVLAARGLQAAYVGCYGNAWVATPALDGLAAGGVVFDRHFADRADAAGARRTWRDGRHHLPDSSHPEAPADDHDDLIAQLRKRGVYTCLVLDDSRPADSPFAVGWDQIVRAESNDPVLEAAAEALVRLAGRDAWLLWVDVATLIPPWDTPEEFLAPYFHDEPAGDEEDVQEAMEEQSEPLEPLNNPATGPVDPEDGELFLHVQCSYAAAVTRLDDGLGRLLERLDAADPADEVLVVVTSDCGFALGEHGHVGPAGPLAYEEAVHVPLILCLPGGDEAGRRVPALTQAADLAATMADVFEVDLLAAHGRTLLPLAYGEVDEIRPYVCSGAQAGDSAEWSLRTHEWAFLLPSAGRPPRLYAKPDDRWEVNNVLQHHQDLAEGLERTLRGFVEAARRPGPLEAPRLAQTQAPAETETSPKARKKE